MTASFATRFRALLAWISPHAHWGLPAIAGVTILIGHRDLLDAVIDNGGDNASHLHAQYALVHALEAGDHLLGPLSLDFGLPILRFYQSLFYLLNVSLHGLTGLDLRLVHNAVVALCFALSPFSYCYFLRALGLRRFAAGFGSLVAATSVGSFGNSFEAYHGIGIATQSMGALFFPLFMGQLIGLLRGGARWSTASLAFAAAFLSHAMMAVYSVLAGALYFLVTRTRLRPVAGRLALFVVFGAAMVSFWALPFVSHTSQHRPVPDSITRGEARRWWFSSVGEHEMVQLAVSGRLLDDPREVRQEQVEPLDKLMEKVTMGVTVRTRFPFVTALTGLGLLVALLGFRRAHCRFLAAGFAFSLFLFAGPDDFPLLGRIPLFGLVQTFRCTYLVEFFAFGLVGLGIEAVIRHLWGLFACRSLLARRVAGAVLAGGLACGIGACVAETSLLASLNTRIHPREKLDTWFDSVSTLVGRAHPFRVMSMERWNSYRAWLAAAGFRAPCSHWGAIAPTSSLFLCHQPRGRPPQSEPPALAGARYIAGSGKAVNEYRDALGQDGTRLYQRLANGPDRRGKSNRGRYLLDMGQDSFLHPLRGWPLPVVCDDRQWLWVVHGWMERYKKRLGYGSTPIPMRVARGELEESGLLDEARAVLYLRRPIPEADRRALVQLDAGGGVALAPYDIAGVDTRRVSPARSIWSVLPRAGKREGTAGVAITSHGDPLRSSQRYAYDVDLLGPAVVVLPSAAVPGWTGTLDGEPLELFATGPDMVGALLPAGAHRLVVRWQMPGWQAALLWTSLAALVMALLSLASVVAGRMALRRAMARTLQGGGGRR